MNLSLSFVRGLVASINPCGFVLLPTYLMLFLGAEGARPGSQRAGVRRAQIGLVTSGAGIETNIFNLRRDSGCRGETAELDRSTDGERCSSSISSCSG